MEEWLVYIGVRAFGSMEQHIMATFVFLDRSHDRKIQREELEHILRIVMEMNKIQITDDVLTRKMDVLMKMTDKDNVCSIPSQQRLDVLLFVLHIIFFVCWIVAQSGTLELSEIISAARKDKNIAGMFSYI